MIIYILLLLLSLILMLIRHDSLSNGLKLIILPIFIIILFVLELFRSVNVGIDYKMYYSFFTSFTYNDMRVQFVEPAYAWLTTFAQKIHFFYLLPLLVLFIGLIGIWKLGRQFHLNKFSLLSFFVLTGIYFQSFDVLRQYIAIGIICMGFSLFLRFYNNRNIFIKYIIFILYVYIAFNFHKSAVIGLIFMILTKIHIRPHLVIISFFLSLLLSISKSAEGLVNKLIAIAPFYSIKYNSTSMTQNVSISNQSFTKVFIRFIPILIQFILLYFYVKRNYKSQNYKTKFVLSGYLVYLILSMLITFWGSELRRIQLYFLIFPLFYSCMYIDEFYFIHGTKLMLEKIRKKELLSSSNISKYIFILLWVIIYIAKLLIDNEEIVPYKFI